MSKIKNTKIKLYLIYLFLIVITILFPLFSVFLNVVLFINNKVSYKFSIFLLAFNLSIIAYYTIPYEGSDLYRHFQMINTMKWSNVTNFIYYGYNLVYVNSFIMFFSAKLNNPAIYTFILTFIGYYSIFYILKKEAISNNINKKYLFVCLLFVFTFSFFKIYVFALRQYCSFALILYAFYKYESENYNKYLTILIVLSSILIHTSSLLILIIWLLTYIKNHKKVLFIFTAFFIIQFLFPTFYSLLYNYIGNFIFDKINHYLQRPNYYNLNFYIMFIISNIFFIIILYKNKKYFDLQDRKTIFFYYLLLLSITFIYKYELYKRFIYSIYIFSPIVFFNKKFNLNKSKLFLFFLFSLLGIGLLANLASLRAYRWDLETPLFSLLSIIH